MALVAVVVEPFTNADGVVDGAAVVVVVVVVLLMLKSMAASLVVYVTSAVPPYTTVCLFCTAMSPALV